MWVIDDDNLPAFLEYWKRRHPPKPTEYQTIHWTPWAIDCYKAKCRCAACEHDEDCARLSKHTIKRYMKDAVLKLFAELGAPPER